MPCLFYDSPIGPMTLVQEGEVLARLDFDVPSQPEEVTPLLLEACRQLREYFAGERKVFALPLAPEGTEDVRFAIGAGRYGVSEKGVGGSPGYPLGRDSQLWRHCPGHRETHCLPGCGNGQRQEPPANFHPLPPSDWHKRFHHRLFRRVREEEISPPAGGNFSVEGKPLGEVPCRIKMLQKSQEAPGMGVPWPFILEN